jgi:hypothetical protein
MKISLENNEKKLIIKIKKKKEEITILKLNIKILHYLNQALQNKQLITRIKAKAHL